MSDQVHPNAVRLQSSAIVVAALITTLGAVTAACIQTGIFGKPVAINALCQPRRNSPNRRPLCLLRRLRSKIRVRFQHRWQRPASSAPSSPSKNIPRLWRNRFRTAPAPINRSSIKLSDRRQARKHPPPAQFRPPRRRPHFNLASKPIECTILRLPNRHRFRTPPFRCPPCRPTTTTLKF